MPDGNSSGNIPSKNSDDSNPSNGSDAEANGSTAPGAASPGGGDGSGAGGARTGQGNQATGGGAGKGGNGAGAAGDIGGAQKLTPVPSPAAADDGSSPLVPVLIAVAVLAAISVGAYYYRQRRQGPGSTVSPKAS